VTTSAPSGAKGRRFRLGVGGKFLLILGVLVPAVMAVAVVAGLGLRRMHDGTTTLTDERLRTVQHSADLVSAAYALHETALLQIAADSPEMDASVNTELDEVLIPRFENADMALRADYAGDQRSLTELQRIRQGLKPYLELHRTTLSTDTRAADGRLDTAARSRLAERIDEIFTDVVERGERMRARESALADSTRQDADATYRSTTAELVVGVVAVLVLGLAMIAVLIRQLVPRIRGYSRFAGEVASGRPTDTLAPRGSDELTELGHALNAMVAQRELQTQIEAAQAEFVDTLQVADTEDEAHDLVKRHLERSVTGGNVVVLRRNNSANKLEAATALPPGNGLAERLGGAEPRSCAAIRVAKTYHGGGTPPPLLACAICSDLGRPSTCEPLLVGGEVIGSVLVSLGHPATAEEDAALRHTVAQAAPMLANLRNLALAEFRANSDALTGLPNKRATDDTLKRMVAYANRSVSPLSAIMLDLDHFKQINDRYGHGKGDEVLAAVGLAITANLRGSDFAGRFGGEEFLVLLPDTTTAVALPVAERIRVAIAGISLPGLDRDITASLGIADLLEHAGTADGLIHEADRALYAAKAQGRDRTVLAAAEPSPSDAVTPAHAFPGSAVSQVGPRTSA
jgi:diguanylate cyclase (GGDEF)-like protein